MVSAPGHRTLVTHVFDAEDKYLDSDAVFGVKDSLIRDYVPQPAGKAPDGKVMDRPYFHLNYDFKLQHLDSHPLQDELGIVPEQRVTFALRMHFDFLIDVGEVRWAAPGTTNG